MMSLKKFKMKSWLLIAAVFISLCAVMGLMTLTVPEAEAAGSGPLKVGSNYYSTWEEATKAAGNSGTIVVMSNYTFPDTLDRYDVPSGVTLLLPYNTSSTSVNGAGAKHPYANETLVNSSANPGKPYDNVSVTVTVPKNVRLYVYGKLVVGGTIGSAAGTLWSGGTIGAHANLQVDGIVDLRGSAKMAVTGYVVGSGTVMTTATNAEIYEPMAVEYRGGHHTAGVADSLNAHSGEGKLCPFFQWSIQNIRTNLELTSGNSLHVYVDLYALKDHNLANACFVGSSGAFLNLSSGTTLYSTYEETKPISKNGALYAGRKNIRLVGSANTASLTIPTSVMTVETKNYNFPIPYNFHISMENGTLSVTTKTQLLPGAKVEIKQGAKLNVGSELFVYTGANDFTASASPDAVTLTYPNKNQKHLIYPSTAELETMEGENGVANLIVDGEMTFSSGGKFAGVVQTNGTGQINTTNMTTGTLTRSWCGAGKFDANCETRYMAGETVRTLSPMLYSRGARTVTTMAPNKTYNSNYDPSGGFDDHTIKTFQYTLYYSSSGSNKTYTEELNADVVGSWGDTACTIIPVSKEGQELADAKETVYLMNDADISALGYYSSKDLASGNLVKKYTGQTKLYKLYGGKTYEITWQDRDGTLIDKTTVIENTLPSYTGSGLKYYYDGEKPMGATGWDRVIVPATENATYTATYEEVEAKVEEPDGRVWYIKEIGGDLYNFSNFDKSNETYKNALGIMDGSTVTLLKNTHGRISIYANNLTFDLNGYTFRGYSGPAAVLLQQSGIKFTLTNSKDKDAGGIVLHQVDRWDMHHAGVYIKGSNCEVLIHHVKIDASADPRGFAVYSGKSAYNGIDLDGNKVTLDDAELIGKIGGVYMDNAFSLNIMGSTRISAIVPVYCELKDYTDPNGKTYTATLNISGGTFESTGVGTVTYTPGTEKDEKPNGPGLPLDAVAGSALVIDYTNSKDGVSISDGTFIGYGGITEGAKDPITLVQDGAVQSPSKSGPTLFVTGGYYNKSISTRFYDTDSYSCLRDSDTEPYHVYIPTYTITWMYNSLMDESERIELKTDTGVPLNTEVKYRPDGSTSEYKDLPTYTANNILYGFTGWSPALAPATEDVTYTAQYGQVNAKVESSDGSVRYILLNDASMKETHGVKPGDTVTLLTDVWTRPNIDVPITFDLNGHKMTGSTGYQMGVRVVPGTNFSVTITDSKYAAGTGGIVMRESTVEPSVSAPYAAVAHLNGDLTLDHVKVTGSTVRYTPKGGPTYTQGVYPADNTLNFDSYGVYSKERSNLTLIDATITGYNAGVYMGSQSHSLTVQGNTSIKAPVPIYCSVESYWTGKGAIRIEDGTFEATSGTPAYYKNSAGKWERLPNSALVIDYASTDSEDPKRELDVLIIGGTFKGYDNADPIRLIAGKPSKDDYDYTSTTHVKPGNFVLSGYFSKAIDTSFYDSATYVCEPDDAHGGLYRLSHPIITWKDDQGNVLHKQEVPMGEVPKYTGDPEKLQKDGKYVTGWTPEIAAVTGSTSYTAVFDTAKARVIAPDGSVTYYQDMWASDSTAFKKTAVFTNVNGTTVLNTAIQDGSTAQMLGNQWGVTRVTGKITLDLNGFNIWANKNPYAVYATGSSNAPTEITITNSAATGGEITAEGMQATPNGNEGVITAKSYTAITLKGVKITTRDGTSSGTLHKGGIGVQVGGTASSVTIKDTTINAGSVGVYVFSPGGSPNNWPGGYSKGLTIEGENTSISAATPVYCMGANLDITGGTLSSTGQNDSHSIAYYNYQRHTKPYVNDGTGTALPLSALVIDKSTSPAVSISGGTFAGYDTTEPISIVGVNRPSGADGAGTTGTAPTNFVSGGYYSKQIDEGYYDTKVYSCVQAGGGLYVISAGQVYVTFDLNGHGFSFTQTAQDGSTVTRPTDPTHHGFAFGGWYKEAACQNQWDFDNDNVKAGTTIYAKWTMNSGVAYKQSDSLTAGNTLTVMTGNYVKNNKHFYVAFDAVSLGSGSVRIGHGETEYSSEYVDLTASSLKVTQYYDSSNSASKSYTHGLNLSSGRVELLIDVGFDSKATITLRCGGTSFVQKNVPWDGCNGDIYVRPTGVNLTNVDAHWSCDDYDSAIWFFGDSWFSYNTARWPYYFYQDGYTDYLFSGYPGMGSVEGLASFRQALGYGKPTYAVWCMGMNNADSNVTNSDWLTATTGFIELCQEKEITPILTTIPSGSERNHSYKNEWIRNSSGVAYVDVERAVIQDRASKTWYTGFAEDGKQVHPSADGAKQIYIEIVEKLLNMKALTLSNKSVTPLQATAKNVSDVWHGNEAYKINAATGKFYSADGTTPIARDSVMTHNWGEATYAWADEHASITASHTCTLGESYTETENGTITSKVTQEPTCEAPGTRQYTATFTTKSGFTEQTVTGTIPKITCVAHVYTNGEVTGHAETLQSAVNKVDGTANEYIQMLSDIAETNCKINKTVYLDLNGHHVTGPVTVADGFTLYGMDSKTDGYEVSTGADAPGSIVVSSGNVAKVTEFTGKQNVENDEATLHRYLDVANGTTHTFHRFNISVTDYYLEVLSTGDASIGFGSTFRGDDAVIAALKDMGFTVNGVPESAEMSKVGTIVDGYKLYYTVETTKKGDNTAFAMLSFENGGSQNSQTRTVNFLSALKTYYDETADERQRAIIDKFMAANKYTW